MVNLEGMAGLYQVGLGSKSEKARFGLAGKEFSPYEPAVLLRTILGGFAVLSFVLMLWQWLVAIRFPLHKRVGAPGFRPGVTLLKPLKGCDETTEACLRSWFTQEYSGAVQVLFGVASAEDPVCELVRKLLKEFAAADAQLIICGPLTGTNLKVSKLVELMVLAKHDVLVISDADVRVPPDFLANVVAPLEKPEVGLVNCFYSLANPRTLAMDWEAVAINADFWSQVLQSQSLKSLDFALGAVMATRRRQLEEAGGFEALKDCLADDYQLGNRIARKGYRIALSTVAVECWSAPMGLAQVWKHQLRWARTIRVCQPVPYFFSIVSNPTIWPLIWLLFCSTRAVWVASGSFWLIRCIAASDLQLRLTKARARLSLFLLPLSKDLLQAAIWLLAFAGNRIEWRGERMKLKRDGTLVRA